MTFIEFLIEIETTSDMGTGDSDSPETLRAKEKAIKLAARDKKNAATRKMKSTDPTIKRDAKFDLEDGRNLHRQALILRKKQAAAANQRMQQRAGV